MTSSAELKWIREVIKRVVAFPPGEDWIVIGWVVAIKALLFVIGVKSYPMLWDKYAPDPESMVRAMGSVGFRLLPKDCRIWI